MIRAALALALAAAGCGHSFGPCEGTCVDVTVTYDGPAAVRQLAIAGRAPDGFSSQLALPAQPADPIDFPAYFTLRLDPPHAPLDLTVVGLDGAREVAAGAAEAIPAAGARTAVTIALGPPPPDAAADDARDAATDAAAPDASPRDAAADAAADLGSSDAAPADAGQIALVRFGRFTGAQAGLLDIAVDGAIAAQGLTVGRLTNYLPLSAGVHLIELRSAGVVLASMKLDLEPPSLTTVYGWQQGCGNGAYAIEQVALAPVPAAGKADIDIVNAACSNQTSSYLVDLAAAGSAKANQALRVSVTPAKHHVERLFAPSIDVTAAAGEVWSVFDYVDATGAEVMEAERDAP